MFVFRMPSWDRKKTDSNPSRCCTAIKKMGTDTKAKCHELRKITEKGITQKVKMRRFGVLQGIELYEFSLETFHICFYYWQSSDLLCDGQVNTSDFF